MAKHLHTIKNDKLKELLSLFMIDIDRGVSYAFKHGGEFLEQLNEMDIKKLYALREALTAQNDQIELKRQPVVQRLEAEPRVNGSEMYAQSQANVAAAQGNLIVAVQNGGGGATVNAPTSNVANSVVVNNSEHIDSTKRQMMGRHAY